MMCSNGNSYLMYCAPGTMNQGGRKYSDFCDINLNDYGYDASKPGSQKALRLRLFRLSDARQTAKLSGRTFVSHATQVDEVTCNVNLEAYDH